MYASFGRLKSAFGKVGDLYTRCLTRSPYVTNCTTGFIVATAGDMLCQKYMDDSKNTEESASTTIITEGKHIDMRRALEMGLIRAALVTPFTQFWYGFLLRIAPGKSQVFKRVVIDQAIGSPIVIVMVFLAKGILQLDLESSKDMISNNLVNTWFCGLSYWPIMHAINFRFVPLLYQPTYATFASLYWNAVLSYYSNNVKTDKTAQPIVAQNVDGVKMLAE